MPQRWEPIASRKRAERLSKIPKEWLLPSPPPDSQTNVLDVPRTCGILTAEEVRITEEYDAVGLVEEMAAGRLRSVDVTRAFCKRAAVAQQLTNCLTEIFFDQALSRAAWLDTEYARTRLPTGPLHGLPISLKDSFNIPGHDSSLGLAALSFSPARTTTPLVDLLLDAGAVLYCKTNVPQLLMALDSHNNIFGRTLNPQNRLLTAGGSSGGEGALVAMRGSPLGVGTDVGGSIRVPAMCNGLFGVKPSVGRVSNAGQQGVGPAGMERLGVGFSTGPIARSLRDCEMFMRAVGEGRGWEGDADVVPGRWEDLEKGAGMEGEGRRKVVGVVRTDGVTRPLPPIERLMTEVGEKLVRAGVEVVELDLTPILSRCQSVVNGLFGVFGGQHAFKVLNDFEEPLSPWYKNRLRPKQPLTLEQTRQLHEKRQQLEREFLRMWKLEDGRQIDALICPVAPHPTPRIDAWNTAGYTSMWVLLDCPAGTVPVRDMELKDLEGELPDTEPLSSWDKMNRGLWPASVEERKVYLDSSLCVQVVAPKLQERRLVEAMRVVDDAVRGEGGKREGNWTEQFQAKL